MTAIHRSLNARFAGNRLLGFALAWLAAGSIALRAALPAFDFTDPAQAAAWVPTHDLGPRTTTAAGTEFAITGSDPYVFGPARDYPAGQPLWLRLRLKSDQGGGCQIFYFPASGGATEARSVRFDVPAGEWVTGRVPLPALGPQYRLRVDPPGTGGQCILASLSVEARGPLPDFDFSVVPDTKEWQAAHDIAGLQPDPDGLHVAIGGGDPYLFGPARDYPADTLLWLRLRLRSDQSGTCQVFYFPQNGGPSEAQSVRFAIQGGDWVEAKVQVPALGSGYRLRIDPPGSGGGCVLGRLWFEARTQFAPPAWPQPTLPELGANPALLESGELKVVHNRTQFGGFSVEVGGERMAAGNTAAMIGYVRAGQPHWFAVNGSNSQVFVEGQGLVQLADAQVGGYLTARVACADPDGGQWQLEQTFRVNTTGSLQVESSARCDQDRDVLYLPLFTLLPGLGNYGTNKTQALLAGVEYLANEPSSSTADLNAPASNRQVPDTAKLTLPLMAVAAQGRYLGLAWNQPPGAPTCAVFDSPDRLFGSGAQVMGLLFPGSDGLNRDESSLIPYDTVRLPADRRVSVAGLLLGGRGQTVVPAVQDYVRLFGLPPLPPIAGGAPAYWNLAAHGWLDSQIRDGDRYRHAAPGFGSAAVADAAVYEDWLEARVTEAALATRLTTAAQGALAQVPPANYNHAQVGHERYPLPALVYGAVAENLVSAEQSARGLLGRFESAGFIRYQPAPGGTDYGRTHWAPEANGLTAQVLSVELQEALFTGRRDLIDAGLRHLRALTTRYANTVPRGAQTWEIPLHTPDILAAAYLVNCYVLGFELTRDPEFLEQARYWAWTGVPFVYLTPPTAEPVGVYSTIPVLGATGWVAPVWIGLPVQWCGLVYADALYRLAQDDAGGPWRQLADGIALSGIQQTHPATDADFQGLLPDSFNLRAQGRNGPNINPATVLAPAIRALGQPAIYDFQVLNRQGLIVQAPGEIAEIEEGTGGAKFTVHGWPAKPYYVVISGLRQAPGLRLNGAATALGAPHEYQAAEGRLILRLEGTATVELAHPALAALQIERLPGGDRVRVLWPAAAPASALQTTTGIGPGSAWEDLAAPPAPAGDRLAMTVLTSWPQRFFRLR